MQFLKWSLFFVVSFVVSTILIFTFSQEPFRQEVPARIITYNTPNIPIYVYVIGSFTIGLLVGLFVAVYNFIVGRKQIGRLKKDLKERTRQVEDLQVRANELIAMEEERVLERERQTVAVSDEKPGVSDRQHKQHVSEDVERESAAEPPEEDDRGA